MEGLVNYSSEDEQEEPSYSRKADGSMSRGTAGNDERQYRRSGGGGGGYKDEAYTRHSSSHQRDGGSGRSERYSNNSYSRDIKESRADDRGRGRDSRDIGNGHKRHHDEHRSTHRDYERYSRDTRDTREEGRGRDSRDYSNGHKRHHEDRSVHDRYRSSHTHDNSSRSRHSHNQSSSQRYASTSNRLERSRPQQSSNKYSSRNRRTRSRSYSKERKSPTVSERPKSRRESDISPKHEIETKRSHQIEQPIVPLMSIPIKDIASSRETVDVPIRNSAAAEQQAVHTAPTEATKVIQLPSYYNPSVVNPTKYAEQAQKRKLLWGAKKTEDTAAKWGNAHFSQDTDGKVASKFMRLMGIKNAAAATQPTSGSEGEEKAAPDVRKREAMFSTMEQQYEVARQATHTMRGVGLGFSSSRPY